MGADPHDVRGQTNPPLSSLLVSPGVSGFQRSLHEDCLLCSSPHPPARASSNTGMPPRQLCGGSCLDHLKADGWAGICCRPPRERGGGTAPSAWAQEETDGLPVSTPRRGVWGWAGTTGRGALAGSPQVGPSKGQDSALHLLRGAPALTPQPHHLSGHRGPTPAPCTS